MKSAAVLLATLVAVTSAGTAVRSETAEAFYRGKTITFICGFSAGGGYDLSARLLAKYLPRYIPGSPSVIVQTMTGAGTVRAANYVYSVAPKDGTVIAAVNQNIPLYHLLGGKAATFDASKFIWLGSMGWSNGVVYMWHTSKVRTIEVAKREVATLGATGTGGDGHIYGTLLNRLLGTKFKIIQGYPGATEIQLAIQRGEVDGRGGTSYAGLVRSDPDWITERKINFLVQVGLEKEPDLQSVALLRDMVSGDRDRQIVDLVALPTAVGYAHWMAPEVPKERIEILRKAYLAVLADPDFTAEAGKAGLMLRPVSGEDLQKTVGKIAATPREVIAEAARVLDWKE